MSQESNSAIGICRIFASGKTCRFGNFCRYLHSRESQDVSLKEIYQDSSGGLERRVCTSYLKTRFCRFGAQCRYSHSLPTEASQVAQVQKAGKDGSLSCNESDYAGGSGGKPYFSLPLPAKKHGNDNRQKQHGHGEISSHTHRGNDHHVNPDGRKPGDPDRHVTALGYGPRPRQGVDSAPGLGSRGDDADGQHHGDENEEQTATSCDVEQQACDDVAAADLNPDPEKPVKKQPRRRLCRYYKAGHCSMGKRCRFWHPENFGAKDSRRPRDKENVLPSDNSRTPIVMRPTEYDLASLSEEELRKLRQTEIGQIHRRYPKAQIIEDEKEVWSCQLEFTPSDPDWVYDVKKVILVVSFAEMYPSKPMTVDILEEQEMPATIVGYTQKAVNEWISSRFEAFSERGKIELMYRQFTRWLDRNIEEFFTQGLKHYRRQLLAAAAGVEFISGAELQEEYSKNRASQDEESEDEEEDESSDEEDLSEDDSDDLAPQPSHVGEMPPESADYQEVDSLDAVRKGTEVKLMKLQLEENAATLRAQKVKVIVQCSRCKNQAELSTPCGRVNQLTCTKCSQDMLVTFRANMAHQFSAVIGYMDLLNCVAFDLILIDCQMEIGCFNCNRDMRIEGLPIGQPWETFCHHCHKKMKLSTESVRFLQLQTATDLDFSDAHVLESKKTKKIPKDPAIQLGKPLPYDGTCKHYKKSFRWLRFPCCGKAYPCDICHEEGEGDHEMARANRMICGFCCKEQMYAAEKPCSACGYHLTKKSTAHWEGGRGCRDKIKMSRDDAKKFTNVSKTVSKRAQAKKETKGKKTTKLRHA